MNEAQTDFGSTPVPHFWIIGGPNWVVTDRFDIVAKPGGDVPPNGPVAEQVLMRRSLLIERFKLVAHRETCELPIYSRAAAS